MTSRRKALVTGATGFIGSRLTKGLVREGWKVHILVRPQSDLRSLHPVAREIGVNVHDGSTEQLCRIMESVQPDMVYHLASLFVPQHEVHDVLPLVESNVAFPTSLLEAMAQNGLSHFINTGTSWQYYHSDMYHPTNLYAATKQALEDVLQYYVDAAGMKAVTLMIYDTYGPDDPRRKLINILLETARTGQPLAMSPGKQHLDLVHVEDVCQAYLAVADLLREQHIAGHERYAVTSGVSLSLRDIVSRFESALGRDLPIQWGTRSYRVREVMRPWDGGRPIPGWQPKIVLSDGLADLIDRMEKS